MSDNLQYQRDLSEVCASFRVMSLVLRGKTVSDALRWERRRGRVYRRGRGLYSIRMDATVDSIRINARVFELRNVAARQELSLGGGQKTLADFAKPL